MLEKRIKSVVRDIPDFPKAGITFKDITPLMQDVELSKQIGFELRRSMQGLDADCVLGIESRGFLFGMPLAMDLGIPFSPIRKKGKLPYKTIGVNYELEYGTASIEMHVDAIAPGMNVIIHDDLLATGGTAEAAAQLVEKAGGKVCAFSFLLELSFLNGRQLLTPHCSNIANLAAW